MAIVTLTTDLGIKDYYVGAVKGALLSINPNLTIVDITHRIPAFDIAAAAFTLKNSYTDFPKGTIHIIGVNTVHRNDKNENTRHLVAYKNGHYFLATDNGLFSILFSNDLDEVYEIDYAEKSSIINFATKEVFAHVAAKLSLGADIETFGYPADSLQENLLFEATNQDNAIRGKAIYIDHFGNILTNVHRELFESSKGDRKFRIVLRKSKDIQEDILEIHNSYTDVSKGDVVAFFAHNGFLEIAINSGKANKLLGIQLGEAVWVEFE